MKKLLLLVVLLCSVSTNLKANPTELTFEIFDKGGAVNPLPKSPVNPPSATLDGYTMTFDFSHPAYTLTLIDEDDEVAYQVTVPANVSVVYLPATLSGDYELQLYPDNSVYYFYAPITL